MRIRFVVSLSQISIVFISIPDAIVLPSGEMATNQSSSPPLDSLARRRPVGISQKWTLVDRPALARIFPSGEKEME